jgi:hypothetical protein
MDVHELLSAERESIVEDAWRSVVMLTHYQRDGEAATRERLELLYDQLVTALRRRDLCGLLDHAERIAKQRYDAGFDLREVQTAFFMLEEAISERAMAQLPAEALGEALGLVGTALRRGKEALARAYLSLATRARAPSLDLSALFKDK